MATGGLRCGVLGVVRGRWPSWFQRIGIGNVERHEGDSGTGKASVLVTLAHPAAGGEQFTVNTGGGTAVAGVDYRSLTKTVTFQPGQRFKVVTVSVHPNQVRQVQRTFELTLSAVSGATVIGSGVGTVSILDDD